MITPANTLSSIRNTFIAISMSIVLFNLSTSFTRGLLLRYISISLVLYALLSNFYINYYAYYFNFKNETIQFHILVNSIFIFILSISLISFYISY